MQAVASGFATFLVGFVLFFMVGPFGFPFGELDGGTPPFSFEANITTGALYRKANSEVYAEPLVALMPPALLVQVLDDCRRVLVLLRVGRYALGKIA